MSEEAPTAEAKKADGARWEALLSPRPPEPTGRVACAQAGSSMWKWMLVI